MQTHRDDKLTQQIVLDEAILYRRIVLIGSFFYVLLGVVRLITRQTTNDPVWVRLLIALIPSVPAAASYVRESILNQMRNVFLFGVWLVTAHAMLLIYLNPSDFKYTYGVILLASLIMALAKNNKQKIILASSIFFLALIAAMNQPMQFLMTFLIALLTSISIGLLVSSGNRRLVEAIQLSHANIVAIVENTKDAMWSLDKNLNITTFNSNLESYFQKALVGKIAEGVNFFDILPANKKRMWFEYIQLALREDSIILEDTWNFDDKSLSFETSFNPIFTNEGVVVGISIHSRNITDKKDAESIIAEQKAKIDSNARLSALGEMASGVAHEINNPLAIILGYIDELKESLSGNNIDVDVANLMTSKIESNAIRIGKIVKGLRAVSRDGSKDPFERAKVAEIMGYSTELVNQKAKNQGVDLRIKPINENLTVMCRPTEIAQIMINLINNSMDAIEELDSRWIEIEIIEEQKFVRFLVTDSGSGIPEAIRQKILQPFFTTKGVGKGTGLGLSISKGIIENHKGEFYLDDKCPNTRFVFTLPR